MKEKISVNLPIIFHFHQPVDQKGYVYEDVYQKSYKPLIDNLFHFKEIKFTLHFSGNLLEWFIKNKPDFIDKLKAMAKRNQIEIIGGGFYEPIFAIIPRHDKIAQLKLLSDLIKFEFNLDVKGAWLSERVWEPNYPSFLNDSDISYALVDDNHFLSAGITEKETYYSYITEDEGKTLRIFPINEKLRYLAPWKPTYMSIEYLKNVADEQGDRCVLFMSDAEKMGVWTNTHQICYIQGHEEGDEGKPFIPTFFDQIIKNTWIKSITLSEYMEKFPAKSLIYLPTASYDKMEEWVLPTKKRKVFSKIRKKLKEESENLGEHLFLKGGFWRYFLVKYPESNNMHKKMLHVRDKLIRFENNLEKILTQESRTEAQKLIKEAWTEIYKSQCNDCYWHGLFGGVYLQFLRFSVYTHLINSEIIIDNLNTNFLSLEKNYISIIPLDINIDGRMDIIIESDKLNIYINPTDGGTIFEIDYKPKSYNILNTLTRWPEAYHDNADIENADIIIDRFKRSMFRLRFFRMDASLNQIETDQYEEFGSFVDGIFNVIRSEKDGTTAKVELEMNGHIRAPNSDEIYPCNICKSVIVEESSIILKVNCKFENAVGKEGLLKNIVENLYLGVDLPFFFNGEPNKFQWSNNQILFLEKDVDPLLKPSEFSSQKFKAYHESYDLNLEYSFNDDDKAANDFKNVYKFPILTYAFTDEGYKHIYQGINLLPRFKLSKEFEYKMNIRIF